jgi:putative oxidoreductase
MRSGSRTKLQTAGRVVQILLLLAFGTAGAQKLTMSIADLAPRMSFVQHVPEWLVRFIGAAEVAGALGLLWPLLFRGTRWLAPLAAAGLGSIMVLALVFHLWRGELGNAVLPLVLGALSILVFWSRSRGAPVAGRAGAEPLVDAAIR